MTRNLWAATFLPVAARAWDRVVLLEAQGGLGRRREAPEFEVDPMWPKPLPNHWLLGMTIGVSVDAQDHIWIIHRGGSLEPKEVYMQANPPALGMLPARAAGSRVRRRGQPDRALGRSRARIRLAGIEPRNHGGLQGQRWIGGNGRGTPPPKRSGADGRAKVRARPGRPTSHDNKVLKFTQDGKFLMQIGKPGQSKGSNDIENLEGPGEDVRRSEDQRAVCGRRLRQSSRDRVRRGDREVQAALGRLRPQAATTPILALQSERSARAAVPQSGALRRARERRPAVRVRPFERPHPGVQAGRDVREGNVHREEHAGRRLGVGHRVLEGSAAEVHLSGRRSQREGVHHPARRPWRS